MGAALDTENSSGDEAPPPAQLPHVQKPSLIEWLDGLLPFRLPRINLPQTAKNFDKAASRLVDAGASNAIARIDASTQAVTSFSKACQSFIERGAKQIRSRQHPDMDDRSLAYVLGEARLQQQNREKILEFASDSISLDPSSTDSVEPISDDWLNIFARFASEKSDIDVQILWAKILVGEIRHPGSTKLRTLQHLATFDKHDATFAHYMLQSTVDGYFFISRLLHRSTEISGYINRTRVRPCECRFVNPDHHAPK